MPTDHDVMTTKEVAELLRITPRVVRSLRTSGLLSGTRIGKELRFKRSDVMELWEREYK